jgi:Glucose-6-phosphate dehydrogenase, NAD binding domain
VQQLPTPASHTTWRATTGQSRACLSWCSAHRVRQPACTMSMPLMCVAAPVLPCVRCGPGSHQSGVLLLMRWCSMDMSTCVHPSTLTNTQPNTRPYALCALEYACVGDLAKKKIFPALFSLYYEGLLPEVGELQHSGSCALCSCALCSTAALRQLCFVHTSLRCRHAVDTPAALSAQPGSLPTLPICAHRTFRCLVTHAAR